MLNKGLTQIKGIGPSMVKKLNVAKIYTIEDLVSQSTEELCMIDGVGSKTAQNWISEANQLLGDVEYQSQTPIANQNQTQETDCEVESNNGILFSNKNRLEIFKAVFLEDGDFATTPNDLRLA